MTICISHPLIIRLMKSNGYLFTNVAMHTERDWHGLHYGRDHKNKNMYVYVYDVPLNIRPFVFCCSMMLWAHRFACVILKISEEDDKIEELNSIEQALRSGGLNPHLSAGCCRRQGAFGSVKYSILIMEQPLLSALAFLTLVAERLKLFCFKSATSQGTAQPVLRKLLQSVSL